MRQYVMIIALVVWIAFIFMLSSQPYKDQDIQPELHRTVTAQTAEKILPNVNFIYHHTHYSSQRDPFQLLEFLFRKSAHLFIYAVLVVIGFKTAGKKMRQSGTVALSMLFITIVASLDELNQRRIPGRTSNPQDIIVDFIGGCIGIGIYLTVTYGYQRYKTSTPSIK
ncbi:hypothetical protein GZH47_08310 [Paenibacillus rhizovicinus]|uniref:VanZ-like domain-containing protein n=1 Tax=Paenibacillus rhizovicinus TaxID=2704463 RepID=A0A6C0NYR9_9BACL|nr:VanZ family protein [Paenibacillus rhizovicinus]QHW30853.1 hypothetical protein GZH47_08310 [Paenibacillus rhizovicinus]